MTESKAYEKSSCLKLFLYIMGATSCPSICWLHKLNFLYFWWVFKKSERTLSRLTFRKVVVLNTDSCKCCHGYIRSFGLSAHFYFNIGGDSCHDSQQTRSQPPCEGGYKCPQREYRQTLERSHQKARLSLNAGAPLTATCRCFPVNIDANGSPPAEPFLTEVFRLVTAVVSGASLKGT